MSKTAFVFWSQKCMLPRGAHLVNKRITSDRLCRMSMKQFECRQFFVISVKYLKFKWVLPQEPKNLETYANMLVVSCRYLLLRYIGNTHVFCRRRLINPNVHNNVSFRFAQITLKGHTACEYHAGLMSV